MLNKNYNKTFLSHLKNLYQIATVTCQKKILITTQQLANKKIPPDRSNLISDQKKLLALLYTLYFFETNRT